MELSRSTLCAWMRRSAELLRPLYELMVTRVLASRIIWTDDTPVPVLDRTLPQTRQGRFLVYAGDDRHPYSVYDYTASRNRDGPERFLKGFQGFLQADAFSGYDLLCAWPDVTESPGGPMPGESSSTRRRPRQNWLTKRWLASGNCTT